MSMVRILKVLIVTVISFCFLFTFSFMTACGENKTAEEALEEEIEEPEEETAEVEEEKVEESKEGVIGEVMKIESPSFKNNEMIPSNYTCDGANLNPELIISGVQEEAKSLVLILDDPDAPAKTWVHWTIWNIDPKTQEIDENSVPEGAVEGVTDFGTTGYGGPCPPSGMHHYFFKLYALDTTLDLGTSATAENIYKAMQGHILDSAELIGLYERK